MPQATTRHCCPEISKLRSQQSGEIVSHPCHGPNKITESSHRSTVVIFVDGVR